MPLRRRIVEAAFESPEALTAAFVVTWKGRLIAERYGDGVGVHTPLESWSMGKSITATLFGKHPVIVAPKSASRICCTCRATADQGAPGPRL
jgi:hypothetical protein